MTRSRYWGVVYSVFSECLNDKRTVSLPECVCSKYRRRRQRRWQTGRRRGQRSWKRRALPIFPFPSSPSVDGSVSLCLYNKHTSTCWDVKYLYSTDYTNTTTVNIHYSSVISIKECSADPQTLELAQHSYHNQASACRLSNMMVVN